MTSSCPESSSPDQSRRCRPGHRIAGTFLWAVEAEQLRRRRLKAQSTMRTGILRREHEVRTVRRFRPLLASGDLLVFAVWSRLTRSSPFCSAAGLGRVQLPASVATISVPCPIRSASSCLRQPAPHARALIVQPVDHHLDVVPHLTIELQIIGQLHYRPVCPCSG